MHEERIEYVPLQPSSTPSVFSYLMITSYHRQRKGWGCGAAAPPHFKSAP